MINMKRELHGVNNNPINYVGCTIVDGIVNREVLQAVVNGTMYAPKSITLQQGETINLTTMQVTRK